MDLGESFNDFKVAKVKVSNKSASQNQKTKKQKKSRTVSSSQPQSDQAKCKGEPSLKRFLYSAPDSKYEMLHNKSPTEETVAFQSSQPEQSVEKTNVSPFFNGEQINCKEVNLASDMLGTRENIQVKDTLQQLLQEDDSKENVLTSNRNVFENTKSENWTCPLCNYCFLESEQNSHFVRCIETFQNKADLDRESSELKLFICDICKEDISYLNVDERSIHMNRCIDKQTSDTNFSTITPAIGNPALSITECPLCFKNFATSELRSTHVKKCSRTLGISIQDTITALQLQERHVLERISLGLPLPASKSTPVKTTEKQTKKLILPKTKAASDIQLAKALSLSLNEEEIKKQELISSFENATNPSESFIASLKPPKVGQVPGKKVTRKKKNINKPVPQLLVRTEEERKKILQEKVSTIITSEYLNADVGESKSVPENKSVPTDLDVPVTESHIFWNLAGKADKKTLYYIRNLQEWITPSEISAGSKLLNLSQIPGHHIHTQKSCDYTFSSQSNSDLKSSQEKSSNSIPSTQEMMDLMMTNSTQNLSQNDATLLNCSPKESVPICDSMNYTNMQDGFFVEIKKHDSMVGSDVVINSLRTLVGSSWMSDVDILVSDEKVIPAHKLLLMLRCPALQGILNVSCEGKKSTLNWKDISFNAALKFLNFLYTGTDCWSETDVDIYHLAIRYGITDLQKRLRNKVMKCNDVAHDSDDETKEMTVSSYCSEDNIEIPMEVVICSDEGLSINDLNQIGEQSVTSKTRAGIIDSAHQNITDSTIINAVKNASNCESQSNAEISNSNKNSVNHLITDLSKNANVSSPLEKFNESSTSFQQKESEAYGEQFTCFKPDVYNIHSEKQRSCSPEIFECNSDDDPVQIDGMHCYVANPQTNSLISDSIFNNTTLPIIPGVNRNNIIMEETTRFNEQTVTEPCFNFSNEVTIIHESPRVQSCTPRKFSPFKNNRRFESHIDISDTLLNKKSDSDKFGSMSDVVEMNGNMKFMNQKISPVPRDRQVKPETIDNNELGDVCVLEDSSKPSSLISPVKKKIQSCKQLISPESHESTSSALNKYIKKESFNDITSPKFLSLSSQQTVLRCLDFADKEEIYISDHSSPSSSPTDRNAENNSNFPISTPTSNCASDIHSSPLSNKSVENKIDPAELKSQLTPIKLNFEIDPKSTMSPTSLKCAMAAEKRRNLPSIIENSQNSLTGSEHYPEKDQAPLTDHNLPAIQEIYQDESSNETVKIATNGTYSPVYLTSDDEDACEQDTEHLPEVFDNLRNSPCQEISMITTNKHKMKNLSPKKALHVPVSLPKCSKTASATIKRKDLQRVKGLSSSATATLCIDLDENSCESMECLPNSQLCQVEKSDILNQEISYKDTCSGVHKKVKETPVSKKNGIPIYTISDSPITPLPDYQNMQTPQIKMALKKYGIRPLPRKKAVTILTHIYDETHPWFEDGTEICSSQVLSSASTSSAVASQKETKKRKIASKAISQNTVETTKKSKKVTQQGKQIPGSSSQPSVKPNDEPVQIGCLSQESPEEHYLSQSPNSSKSDDNDFPEESLLHLPDSNENEEIGNDDKIRERIQQYILSNKVLHTKILQYEPLNLTEFHDELKDNQVKIAVAKLMNFLDEQCITFTFPRKEEYRKKQQSRQQKFRKKMIAKLSQPSSEN